MLQPVTFYNNHTRNRDLDGIAYEKRVKEDVNLSDHNLLIKNGNQVFINLSSIIDLTDNLSIDTGGSTEGTFSKVGNFTPISNIKSEFYLKLVPHNGQLSLRRGFYRLVSLPIQTMIANFETWQADVFYCEGNERSMIYKYRANVGPLVNRYAVCGNLTTNKTRVLSITKNDKTRVLTKILNRTIYVTSAEFVDNEVYSNPMKEVLWFTWE